MFGDFPDRDAVWNGMDGARMMGPMNASKLGHIRVPKLISTPRWTISAHQPLLNRHPCPENNRDSSPANGRIGGEPVAVRSPAKSSPRPTCLRSGMSRDPDQQTTPFAKAVNPTPIRRSDRTAPVAEPRSFPTPQVAKSPYGLALPTAQLARPT